MKEKVSDTGFVIRSIFESLTQFLKFITKINGFYQLYLDYEYDGQTLDFIVRNYQAVLENRTKHLSKPTYEHKGVLKEIDRWYANNPKWYKILGMNMGRIEMTEREIKLAIIENAETMAKSLAKGKDLEVRKSQNGISVAENAKKVIVR